MLRRIGVRVLFVWSVAGLLSWFAATGRLAAVSAQETKPQAASDATTQLPKPDPAFKGKIGETYKDSTPSYPLPVKAPKGSPNVLLILLDDVGFGMCSTFGGPYRRHTWTSSPTTG